MMGAFDFGAITANGIMLIVVLGLFKTIEVLLTKRNGKKNGHNSLTHEEHKVLMKMAAQTQDLVEAHAPRDNDGIPLFYTPRHFGKAQEEILLLHRKTLKGIDSVVSGINSANSTLNRIESRINKSSIIPPGSTKR